MAVIPLTRQTLVSLVCPTSQLKRDFFDVAMRGFMVEVRRSGKKTFYFRYSDSKGKQRQKKLGSTDQITLTEARTLAGKLRATNFLGLVINTNEQESPKVLTISEFTEQHYLPYARTAKRSWETDVSVLSNHLLPRFGSYRLNQVIKKDIIEFMTQKREAYAAGSVNRMVILLRYMYNLALKWEFLGAEKNPANGITLLEDNGARERFLSKQEAERILYAVKCSENQMLYYIVLWLLLTGARKSEALNAQWGHIKLEQRSWYIPHTKAGKPRYVPISDDGMKLLAQIPQKNGTSYIFTNPRTGKPFVTIFSSWDRARRLAGMPELRIHDLRHSAASFMVNSGQSLYVVQKILGHTQQKTTARYSHLSQSSLLNAVNLIGGLIPESL